MTKPKVKYTAKLVAYTREDSPDRSYRPPAYAKPATKIFDLEVLWGRMDHNGTADLYKRLSAKKFSKESIGLTVFTKKELGNIIVKDGDAVWIWSWKENKRGIGTISRLHLEVETRLLSDKDRAKIKKLLKDLKVES